MEERKATGAGAETPGTEEETGGGREAGAGQEATGNAVALLTGPCLVRRKTPEKGEEGETGRRLAGVGAGLREAKKQAAEDYSRCNLFIKLIID